MSATHDTLLIMTEDECTMPTIHSKNALDTISTGQILELISNKKGTIKNFRTLFANNL